MFQRPVGEPGGMTSPGRRVPGVMTPLGHRRYMRRLDAYVDGELEIRRAQSMTAHVADCWGCSGELYWRRLIKTSTAGIGDHGARDLASARLERWAQGLIP